MAWPPLPPHRRNKLTLEKPLDCHLPAKKVCLFWSTEKKDFVGGQKFVSAPETRVSVRKRFVFPKLTNLCLHPSGLRGLALNQALVFGRCTTAHDCRRMQKTIESLARQPGDSNWTLQFAVIWVNQKYRSPSQEAGTQAIQINMQLHYTEVYCNVKIIAKVNLRISLLSFSPQISSYVCLPANSDLDQRVQLLPSDSWSNFVHWEKSGISN